MNESNMTLLTDFRSGVDDPSGWLMTEKFRGCRALWDGSKLWSRAGNPVPAPAWFTRQLPSGCPLDGELWAGRCEVETKARLAVQYGGEHWTPDIRFVVFDAPECDGPWAARISGTRKLPRTEVWNPVASEVCGDVRHLTLSLRRVVDGGGEGIVLRHPTAKGYDLGRSRNALRVTPLNLNIL